MVAPRAPAHFTHTVHTHPPPLCATPPQALADCTGHFGHIKLELPVFHIGYFKNTVQILQCICKCCSRVLLSDEERRRTLRCSGGGAALPGEGLAAGWLAGCGWLAGWPGGWAAVKCVCCVCDWGGGRRSFSLPPLMPA